jgi:putative flippase GtrA
VTSPRFLRFATIGAACTLIDLVVFYALHNFSVGVILSNIVSYSAGLIINFFANQYWTFPDANRSCKTRFPIAMTMGYLCLGLSTLLVWGFAHILPAMISKGLSVVIMLFINYTVNRLVIFKVSK